MDRLFYFIGDIHHTKLGGADTFSDRLNSKYTVYMLSMFAFLITTFVYVGEPIGCFCPANFAGSHVDFTNKYCWSTNTHYQPFDKDLPKELKDRQYISYYQWIPLFLAGQAIMFYLPRMLWRMLSRKSGIVVYNITDAAIECQRKTDKEDTEKSMKFLSSYMIRHLKELRNRRNQKHPLRVFRRIHYTFYLTVVFILIKLLYAINVVGQLFFVNVFLGTDFHLYGIDVIARIANGTDWTTSNRFPRVTICDFKMRVLHNTHDHTVLCALPMNLYNEMLFIFLWFWFVFVGAVTVASLVYWIAVAIGIRQQVNYVRPRLAAMGRFDPVDTGISTLERGVSRSFISGGDDGIEMLAHRPGPTPSASTTTEKRGGLTDMSRFVESYLLRDGCLIVRLVAENSNDMVAADLLSRLYDHYSQAQAAGPLSRQPPSFDEGGDYGKGPTSLDTNGNGMSTMPPPVGLSVPHRRLSTSSSRYSIDATEMNIDK